MGAMRSVLKPPIGPFPAIEPVQQAMESQRTPIGVPMDFFLLEDGVSFILLEDGTSKLSLE